MAPDFGYGMNLQMAQRQEMVMTPQMIQSMELLQMPLLELEQRIQSELMENPALELAEMNDDFQDNESSEFATAENDTDYAEQATEEAPEFSSDFNDFTDTDAVDYDWNEVYDDVAPMRGISDEYDPYDKFRNKIARAESYPDHLLDQLRLIEIEPRVRTIAEEIISSLDAAGYLNTPLATLKCEELNPVPTSEELEDALDAVQSLHPAGTGARNLSECLLLQLGQLDDPSVMLAYDIAEWHLDDLAANRLPQMAKSLKCGIEDIKAAVALIRTLDPQPGVAFSDEGVLSARPDVAVELVDAKLKEKVMVEDKIFRLKEELRKAEFENYGEKGEYKVRAAKARLNDAQTDLALFDNDDMKWQVTLPNGPEPEISEIFLALYDSTGRGELVRQEMMADPEKAEELKTLQDSLKIGGQNKNFREKFQSASDIVRAVKQREMTIFRVTREITAIQKDYLSGRNPAPAPLMMKEVAERLNIDIGTVSRTARDKFIDTPIGLKPMREFFTRSITHSSSPSKLIGVPSGVIGANASAAPAGNTGEMSNIQIRNRIKEMIDAEDKKKPLKDDVLQKMLEEEDIHIKRRTVAKHRLKLGYKNYSQRREY